MENLMFKSKEELVDLAKVIVENHEKVKQEILILHNAMTEIESAYVEVMNELKGRKEDD